MQTQLANILEKMPVEQRKTGRLLLGFFGMMVVFTLLARSLDTFRIATVSVAGPTYGSLVREYKVEGSVEPLLETAVPIPEGFVVSKMPVQEGSWVEEGDVLAILDTDLIQQQLTQARRDLESARLEISIRQVQPEKVEYDPLEDAELALKRAEEDLESTTLISSEKISRAQEDLAKARRDLRELRDDDFDYNDGTLEAARDEVILKERALEDACQEAERTQQEAERKIEDAQQGLESAMRDEIKSRHQEQAESQTRGLENRRSGLTVEERAEKVALLESLLTSEGVITAPQGGYITKVNVAAGAVTGMGGAFLLAGEDAGGVFVGKLPSREAKELSAGDKAKIALSGLAQPLDAVVTAIVPSEDKEDESIVKAALAEGSLAPGTSGTMTMEKKSDSQQMLLPLSAIHTEGGEKTGYVYVLREKNSVMGTQTVLEKSPVTILEKNKQTAAVESLLSRDDRLVISSSRTTNEGDRVRLVDGES